jgi:hypothetical protein
MPLEYGPDEDMTATEQFMNVVDQAAKEKKEAPMFAKKAWICLDREAVPRKQCIAIMSHKFFDPVILTLIGLNCLTMIIFNEPVLKKMIESYPNGEANSFDTKSPNWAPNGLGIFRMSAEPFHIIPGCVTGPCSTAEWIDWVFLVLFTVEMAIKMLAQGLCMHPHSYLRSGWNWLDFVVVIIGYLETYSTGLPGISTLRLFKTLRPLRSLQRIRHARPRSVHPRSNASNVQRATVPLLHHLLLRAFRRRPLQGRAALYLPRVQRRQGGMGVHRRRLPLALHMDRGGRGARLLDYGAETWRLPAG